MSNDSRGSASLFVMVIVMPLLFILSILSIELTQFFAAREEVRSIVDAEARQSLSRSYPPHLISQRITLSVGSMVPHVAVADVRADVTPHRGEVMVRGVFKGALSQFVAVALGGASLGVPFTVSSTVRRAKTVALILLDRTAVGPDLPCGDRNLLRRATFTTQIANDLKAAGADLVMVGVTPGVKDVIDILSPSDEVPRCPGGTGDGALRVSSLEGVALDASVDSLAIALRASDLLLMTQAAGLIEQRALVVVSPPIEARSSVVPTTFSLINNEASRQRIRVHAVGIVVGGSRETNYFDTRIGEESDRARYLHVSEDETYAPGLRVALVHHIQGRTFLAR